MTIMDSLTLHVIATSYASYQATFSELDMYKF